MVVITEAASSGNVQWTDVLTAVGTVGAAFVALILGVLGVWMSRSDATNRAETRTRELQLKIVQGVAHQTHILGIGQAGGLNRAELTIGLNSLPASWLPRTRAFAGSGLGTSQVPEDVEQELSAALRALVRGEDPNS